MVTSRRRLAGLDDADHLTLDVLPVEEAVRLFRAVVGPGRDPGGEHTVEAVVALCGLLPLAVRVAAALLRTSRSWTGPDLLDRLRDSHDRLAELDDGERSVRAAFSVSFDQLPAEQQHAFAVLGLHPGVDYEPYAAAALLDTTADRAGWLLRALEQVNLLGQPVPGRYRFHDLIRAYATTLAHSRPETGRRDALDRLYDHYAHTATAAVTLAYPYEAGHLPRPPRPATTPTPPLPDPLAALAWLEAEHTNLLAAAGHATGHRPEHTTHQSITLGRHLYTRGHYTAARALHDDALTAAGATGDTAAHTAALTNLGLTHYAQGRYGPAADCLAQALQAARAAGHRTGEVDALNGLGRVHGVQGRYELAALSGLGRVHRAQGRYGPAADCFGQVLDLARETGNRNFQVEGHLGLGRTHQATGHPDHAHHTLAHPDQARHHWQYALNILNALDTPAAEDLTTADIRAHLAALDSPHPEATPDPTPA
jgi:tetratricopeptide (TPR) repeat protein